MERFNDCLFDETHALTIGLRPRLLKAIFFILLSASVVAAMQTVGAFLVIALVVTPVQLHIYCVIGFHG